MIKELRILSAAIAGCVSLGSFSPAITVYADDDLSSVQSSSNTDTGLGYDILTPTTEWSDTAETSMNDSDQTLSDEMTYTDGQETETDSGLTDVSSFYNEVFSSCMTNAANKSDISSTLSNMNSVFDGNTEISVGSYQLFDLSGTSLENNVDLSILNIQYAGLSLDLVESQIDLSGSSTNAVSLFNNTYGDLASQLTLESPSIPESFSSQDMIALGQEAINSTKSSVLNSDTFQTVKNNIDISSVVNTAKNGLTNTVLSADNLQSSSSLSSTLSDISTYASDTIKEEKISNNKKVNNSKSYNNTKLGSVVSSLSNYIDMDENLGLASIGIQSAYNDVTNNTYSATNTIGKMGEGINAVGEVIEDSLIINSLNGKNALTQESIKQAYQNGEISREEAIYQQATNPMSYGGQESLIDTGYTNISNSNS